MSETILSIEAATANSQSPASIALKYQGNDNLRVLEEPNSQAAKLVSSIESLLKQHDLRHDQLDRITITVGPGSFTGIRIGLSVARTIAFACPNIVLTPLTTLEAMAAKYEGDANQVQVVLRAGKGDVYCQAFAKKDNKWFAENEIRLCRPEGVDLSIESIGNGIEGYDAQLDALDGLNALEHISIENRDATPLYIRPPDAKLPTSLTG